MFMLRELRKKKEMTMKELGDMIGVAESTISQYETEKREPDFETLLKLGEIFDVSLDYLLRGNVYGGFIHATPMSEGGASCFLTPAAHRIGYAYEKATPPVQRTVDVALEPYTEENVIQVEFRHSVQAASAGSGVLLGDEEMTTTSVPLDALPKRYERDPDRYFGVPVSGDSMEPKYRDGDILIVSKEPLDVGEVGVVVMDGEGYVKQIGKGVLHSINPRYEDIPINESVHFCGKVVGVLDGGTTR